MGRPAGSPLNCPPGPHWHCLREEAKPLPSPSVLCPALSPACQLLTAELQTHTCCDELAGLRQRASDSSGLDALSRICLSVSHSWWQDSGRLWEEEDSAGALPSSELIILYLYSPHVPLARLHVLVCLCLLAPVSLVPTLIALALPPCTGGEPHSSAGLSRGGEV